MSATSAGPLSHFTHSRRSAGGVSAPWSSFVVGVHARFRTQPKAMIALR